MAEDRFNPLDNPEEATRVSQASRPTRPQPPASQDTDAEFEEFVSESLRQRLNMRETPQAIAPDDAAEGDETFTDDAAGGVPPTSEGAAPEPAPAPPMPQAPRADTTPAPAAAVPEPRYAYNGQYYTLQELATQGLLTEALYKAQQLDQRPVDLPRQEPAPPPMTPQQWQQSLAPMVQQLVDNGNLEEDVATLYPMATTGMVSLHVRLLQAERFLAALAQERQHQQQRQGVEALTQRLETAIDATAQAGPLYAPLQDAATREGFKKYLIDELNPLDTQITPEFVRKQWFAYNGDVVLQLHQQAQAAAQQRQGRPMASAAPGRSARVRAVAEPETDEWDDLLRGRL